MALQIFGTKKCKDTKKAQRFFKERGLDFQFVDLTQKELSKGEFRSVAQYVGGWEEMVNWESKDKDGLAHVQYRVEEQREEILRESPELLKTPIVRFGKKATVGLAEKVWKEWAQEMKNGK